MTPKPFPHQELALEELDKKKTKKNLLVLPSGAGKTHTLAFDVARKQPLSFIYIVHRHEIMLQSIKIFKEIIGMRDDEIGIVAGDTKQYNKRYIFGTIQTLTITKNLEKLPSIVDYLAIDEYHHVAAPSYRKIFKHFKPNFFMGLTATPFRLDGKNIIDYVENNRIANIDIFTGIEKNILCPFQYNGLFDNIDYTKIEHEGWHYNLSDLERHLIIEKRNKAILEEYVRLLQAEGRQTTIAFCVSVKHAEKMSKLFTANGIKNSSISYQQSSEERQEIIQKFRNRQINVLFTIDILNEGVDFPECDSVMLLRPTFSKVIFMQQIGRGLRKSPSKENVKVLDFIGNYRNSFRVMEWLGVSDRKPRELLSNAKPIYKYNIPYSVVFDSKLVELFELQQLGHKYSDKQMIANFLDVKQKLKRTPSLRDMKKHSKIGANTYVRYFGTWNNFLEKVINTKINRKSSNRKMIFENLKQEYFELKEKMKDHIKSKNRNYLINAEWINYYNYHGIKEIREIGGWYVFLKKIGEPITAICQFCDKEFTPKVTGHLQKYCSLTCQRKTESRRNGLPKQKKDFVCQICSRPFKSFNPNSKYCRNKCRNRASTISRRKGNKYIPN